MPKAKKDDAPQVVTFSDDAATQESFAALTPAQQDAAIAARTAWNGARKLSAVARTFGRNEKQFRGWCRSTLNLHVSNGDTPTDMHFVRMARRNVKNDSE